MYCDAHIHIADIDKWTPFNGNSAVCSCFHSIDEWNRSLSVIVPQNFCLIRSFGIHPQNPDIGLIDFLLNLCKHREQTGIQAVGEAGFDLFREEYKQTIESQETVWLAQIDAAQSYNLPLIVHCRHALDRIFRDSKLLAKLPSVIFHSFAGSSIEAQSLLEWGINAYFSFGKPLLNGNKRALHCVSSLEMERIVLETDAPYQTLKGETATQPEDIIKVYEKAAQLRMMSSDDLSQSVQSNFIKAFCIE
jgi:TatD DNase family protein